MAAQFHNFEDDPLLTAFTLACMEFARFNGLDPTGPTLYMRCFAKLYMKDPRSFIVISPRRDVRCCAMIAQRIQRLKATPEWNPIGKDIKANLDFIYPKGDEQIETEATKRVKRKRQRKNKAGAPAPTPDPTSSTGGIGSGCVNKLPALQYDDSRIKHHLENNSLLQAPVKPMPGICTNLGIIEDDFETMGMWQQAVKLDAGEEDRGEDGDEETQFHHPMRMKTCSPSARTLTSLAWPSSSRT